MRFDSSTLRMNYPPEAWVALVGSVLGIGWVIYLMVAQKVGIWPYKKK